MSETPERAAHFSTAEVIRSCSTISACSTASISTATFGTKHLSLAVSKYPGCTPPSPTSPTTASATDTSSEDASTQLRPPPEDRRDTVLPEKMQDRDQGQIDQQVYPGLDDSSRSPSNLTFFSLAIRNSRPSQGHDTPTPQAGSDAQLARQDNEQLHQQPYQQEPKLEQEQEQPQQQQPQQQQQQQQQHEQERHRHRRGLELELEQTRKEIEARQHEYEFAHASIQRFQQLVLTTHAQVQEAKQRLMQARQLSTMTPTSTFTGASVPCSPRPSILPSLSTLPAALGSNGTKEASEGPRETSWQWLSFATTTIGASSTGPIEARKETNAPIASSGSARPSLTLSSPPQPKEAQVPGQADSEATAGAAKAETVEQSNSQSIATAAAIPSGVQSTAVPSARPGTPEHNKEEQMVTSVSNGGLKEDIASSSSSLQLVSGPERSSVGTSIIPTMPLLPPPPLPPPHESSRPQEQGECPAAHHIRRASGNHAMTEADSPVIEKAGYTHSRRSSEDTIDDEDVEAWIKRLEDEHHDLGQNLSQVLRDKAEAEESKQMINESMKRAKGRIREIESLLEE
ncbi:hypothetical protein BGW38_001999 [Lunasporangiospora selenospora]|uniref:Uncharacterized protein n=1 Tax=Lunasporangiospora selenospora TaxID=979761 RepID=A0A9P6FSN5_9FUNG|nr:hypothetical protein BGW38_001999 [Lunasporangiospora selenospora]